MKIFLGKILPFCFILFAVLLSAQNINTVEKVIVKGNCVQCKARIEKAAISADATSAFWSPETKVLELTFNAAKTSEEKFLKKSQTLVTTMRNTAPMMQFIANFQAAVCMIVSKI